MSAALLAALLAAAAQAFPAERAARIDAAFGKEIGPEAPGCSLAVVEKGAIVYEKGYGLANLEHGIPNRSDTVFDIGSVSKQFTAASVLLLAQDGKLSLDDDVRRFVPEVPDYGSRVTVRHLFHHTSGLRDYTDLLPLAGARVADRTTSAEALAMVSRQKGVEFPPGSEHQYCNTGYFLLSVVVERASGKSLRDFAQERLFAPLGMTDTQFLDDSRRIVPRRAAGYAPREGGSFRLAGSNWEQVGDGSLLTTVRDLAKWAGNFEEPKVGGASLVTAMEETGTLTDGRKLEYASGLRVDRWRGLRRVAHSGAWAGYRAALIRFPEQRLALAVTCNRGDAAPSDLAGRTAEILLGERLSATDSTPTTPPPPEAKVEMAEAARVAGAYFAPTRLLLRRIEPKEGKLLYRWSADGTLPLLSARAGAYALASGTRVVFEPPSSMTTHPQHGQPVTFRRVEPWAPSSEELALFAGEYRSAELEAVYGIRLEKGRLVLHRRGSEPTPLTPLFENAFENEDLELIVFGREAGDPAASFEILSSRSKIPFSRIP